MTLETDQIDKVKRDQIARCIEQARLGYSDAALRFLGFPDGCIRDARRFIDADKGPYGEQSHEASG